MSRALDQALDLDEGARAAWLERLAADDPPLAARLAAILGGSDALHQQRFLEQDIGSAAMPMRSPNLAGTRIGPFVIESEAGRGGMGSVWRARRDDGKFNQTVAIKFLASPWADRETQVRFRREARLLGRLDHPNIARLLDAGIDANDRPYLVLEFVEGERIDDYCRRKAPGIPAILALYLQLLDALALAHRQLIVHRDIKPGNVLITGEGVPKLLDFGIARLLEDSADEEQLTRMTRASPMTPGYAAPEQLLGEPADTLTDVYALGVLLHELLTGVRPFDEPGQSAEARLQDIMADRLPPASSRPGASRELRGDLDNIIARTLRRDRRERYASVAAFADDIRRYLRHEPVAARPPTFLYRSSRFIRRNRAGVIIGGIAIIAVTAALITALAQQRVARQQSQRATRELSYSQATHEFLGALVQQGTDKPLTTQQLLDAGESLIDRQYGSSPELRARLLYTLAEQYGSLQQAATAQALLRKAQSLAASSRDPGLSARIGCDLAESIGYTGSPGEAIRMIEAVLPSIQDAQFSQVMASCRASLGSVRAEANDFVTAENDLRTSLALYNKKDEGNARFIMNAREALAGVLAVRGQASAAAAEYRELLSSIDRLGRSNSSLALKYLNNYGLVLINASQFLDASRVFEQGLQRQASIDTGQLGDPALFGNAGVVSTFLGRPQEALVLFGKAATLAARNGLRTWIAVLPLRESAAYCMLGELAQAEAKIREAEPLVAAAFPAMDRQTAVVQMTQGCIARLRGDVAAARRHYERALEIQEKLGLAGSLRATTLTAVANAAADAGDLQSAAQSARRAESLARDALGDFSHSAALGNALLAKARIQRIQAAGFDTTLKAALIELRASVGDEATQKLLATAGFTSPATR